MASKASVKVQTSASPFSEAEEATTTVSLTVTRLAQDLHCTPQLRYHAEEVIQ